MRKKDELVTMGVAGVIFLAMIYLLYMGLVVKPTDQTKISDMSYVSRFYDKENNILCYARSFGISCIKLTQ